MRNQKIIKSGLMLLVAFAVLSTMAVIPVSAQPTPGPTCPDGFALVLDATEGITPGSFPDLNGDGFVCAFATGRAGTGAVIVIDDHILP